MNQMPTVHGAQAHASDLPHDAMQRAFLCGPFSPASMSCRTQFISWNAQAATSHSCVFLGSARVLHKLSAEIRGVFGCEQVLWALCVYVEAVSVLPQLRMMQKAKVRGPPKTQ